MTGIGGYPYASGDLLDSPQSYFYSKYSGKRFVSAWALSRSTCRATLIADSASDADISRNAGLRPCCPTQKYFRALEALFAEREFPAEDRNNLDSILRNFEAKKRVYQDYNPGFTSKGRDDYKELVLYVDFGFLLVAAFARWKNLSYLNALLKILDILCAHRDMLSASEKVRMVELIDAEKLYLDALAQQLGVKIS